MHVRFNWVQHVQSDKTGMTKRLATNNDPKHNCYGNYYFVYDTLHRLEFMLLSKTWPFESKLFDTSFEELLEQNMHNLQSKQTLPCSCVPGLQQRLYRKGQ